jgi:hypothetical protein
MNSEFPEKSKNRKISDFSLENNQSNPLNFPESETIITALI